MAFVLNNLRSENYYSAVATYHDILFRPLDDYGILALAVIKALIHQHRKEFEEIYGIPQEDEENSDRIYLEGLNPVEWKDQDHYAVLGLRHLRFRATEDDVRKAYRKRCLTHHPDKRQAAGQVINPEGDYFACIVKAQEILGFPLKRRSYDSVDPEFSNFVPPKKVQSDTEFFKVYGTWFAMNSRWSNIQPAPLLGNIFATRDAVESFYNFWFNFDSWREYSYLDEEEKEKGQYREERRWIDKQNKIARAKLKKEEMARIRGVVDAAYSLDPRIAIFKEEEQQRKVALKQARQNLLKEKQMNHEKTLREAEEKDRLEQERKQSEAREQELVLKREKESAKKLLKKERKALRAVCKDNRFFSEDGQEEIQHMAQIEHLCEILSLTDIQQLNERLKNSSYVDGKSIFLENVSKVFTQIEKEKEETTKLVSMKNGVGGKDGGDSSDEDWSSEELNLLIKAVNLFPAGTNQRWDVIANFLQQHAPENSNWKKRTARQVLTKAKDLKASDFSKNSMKKVANEEAFAIFEKTHKTLPAEAEASARTAADSQNAKDESGVQVHVVNCNGSGAGTETEMKPWTNEEQKLLEQALKTYSSKEHDRWDRVAACVPGRTKKECMIRFKELSALIKAKKAALQTTGSGRS